MTPPNCKVKAAKFPDFLIYQVQNYLEVNIFPVLGPVAFFVLRIQHLEFQISPCVTPRQ